MLVTSNGKHAVIPPGKGELFGFGDMSGRFKIGGGITDGRFAVAELAGVRPRTLAAPLHRHNKEDEYTYVLSGMAAIMAGDEVITATPGTWIIKPRGEWHTFWNPGDTPCDIIEIVSPAGIRELFWRSGQDRR
jgi:mannose-6-phosphate isomerase-like protein (cupin superfamily)